MIVNPAAPNAVTIVNDSKAAARALGQQLVVLNASTEHDIDTAFAALIEQHVGALLVGTDVFLNSRVDQLVALANRNAVPTIYGYREFAAAGGLMSYGTSLADAERQVGVYAGRILKGAKPADLAVMQAVKVELVLNLNTAKTFGITFPLALLGRADEVIE
jgi:putative ABC transport system substrate-binding protein